ncbi:MAG: aminotransferase class I/II-fold pyridoxal phosphate-dependent enzyme [Oscillospiraceae bacterium]|nr:aminotransferase class I/II-fold pyridoxal phosphate-dependent enzyme [Oscillospiraceae bacterium]
MIDAPLYRSLAEFADTGPLRLHMPGHKGKGLPGWERLAQLDFTELPPTGNLYQPGGAIGQAEAAWAAACGMAACQMLTCGSTQGLQAALTLACPVGSAILVDRVSHRSIFNAMALLDLHPVYFRDKSCQGVERALNSHPEIKTICITSPNYYGQLFDIPAIARLCRQRQVCLVVDGAHGAHLPFLGMEVFQGADLTVCSAHKTLPVLGQGALLFSGGRFDAQALRRAASLYGTSSPSYPILASMDLARAWMQSPQGRESYRRVCRRAEGLREEFPSLTGRIDPARLTLCVEDGLALERALQAQNIWPEMADWGHVVFILTAMDTAGELDRLEQALTELAPQKGAQEEIAPPLPEVVMYPRQALFAPRRSVPLAQSPGQIAAEHIGPYPPGVPVIAPGERIEKKHLAYLRAIRYNNYDTCEIQVVRQ